MAKFKKRRKMGKKGRVFITILSLLLCVASLGGAAALVHNDTKSVNPVFKIGALDEATGQYVADNTAIYTEKAIECQGLRIMPDFDATCTYQIFWYNVDDMYVGCTTKTTNSYTKFVDSVPDIARYCRIVIYPSQLDEEGNIIEDFEVGYLKAMTIPSQLKITVDKKQNFEEVNILDEFKVYSVSDGDLNEVFLSAKNMIFKETALTGKNVIGENAVGASNFKDLIKFDVENISIFKLNIKKDCFVTVGVYDEAGNSVEYSTYTDDGIYYIEVPNATDVFTLMIEVDNIENIEVYHYVTR